MARWDANLEMVSWASLPHCHQWNAGPAQLLAFGSIGVELASVARAAVPAWWHDSLKMAGHRGDVMVIYPVLQVCLCPIQQ